MFKNKAAYNDTAIVIHTQKYSETKLIIHTITQNHARCSFITTNQKKTPRALFQPLNIINIAANPPSTSSGMHTLLEATQFPLQNLMQSNPSKAIITMMISEVAYRVLTYCDTKTFDFLSHTIQNLKSLQNPTAIANFHLHFMVKLSQMQGYAPQSEYQPHFFFNIPEAEFRPTPPINHPHFFQPEVAEILAKMLHSDHNSLDQIALNRHQRQEFLREMIRYYAYHSQAIYTVKSLNMFSEIF